MEKLINFSKISKASRVITLLLCFILLFVTVARPITAKAFVAFDPASAALTAWLYASGFYADSSSALAEALAQIMLPIEQGVSAGLSQYIKLSNLLYDVKYGGSYGLDSASNTLLAKILLSVLKTTKLLSHVSVDTNDESLTLQQIPTVGAGVQMYVPTYEAMQDVMSITQFQVLYGGFINEQVELTKETNATLETIRRFLGKFDLELRSALSTQTASIKSSLSNLRNNLTNRLDTINTTLKCQMEAFAYRINHLNQTLENTRELLAYRLNHLNQTLENTREILNNKLNTVAQAVINTRENIDTMRTALSSRLDKVYTVVQTLPQDFANTLKEKFPALQQTLDEILEKIPAYEEIEILDKKPVFDEALGELGFAEDQLVNKTDDGKKYVPIYIGYAKDLLEQYKTAFLAIGAVLAKFLDLPVVGDLVKFSLALGIFALVVNLANTSISKDSENSARGRKTKTAKGG